MDIEKFSECCLAKICRDQDNNVNLVVCCVLRDPDTGKKVVHKKEVNLNPLIQYADRMLRKYHAQMHNDNSVGGSWDDMVAKAEDVAKRIGEARLVRSLFTEVSPMMSKNDAEPDGAESAMHQKAHAVLVKAREGDRKSLDVMASLMNAAYRGNARALEIMVLMRDMNYALDGKEAAQISGVGCAGITTPELIEIGSWWSKFKKVAKYATAPVWAPTYLATKAIQKVPGLNMLNRVNPAAWVINRMKSHDQPALPPPAAPPDWASAPPAAPPPPAQDPGAGMPAYQGDDGGGYDDGGDDQPDFAGPQADVSGWVYNKGYRGVAEAVTAPFPGLGITMREMYHRGYDSSKALAVVPVDQTSAQTAPAPTVATSGTYIVGFSWHGLMNKAKSMYNAVKNTGIIQQVAPIVAQMVPGGGMALQAAEKAAEIVALAKEGKHDAVQMVAAIRSMAEDGNVQALDTAKVMKAMSDRIDQKTAATPPAPVTPVHAAQAMVYSPRYAQRYSFNQPSAPMPTSYPAGFYHRGLGHRWINKHLRRMHQPEIAGWFYNKPYRGVLEAPGAGVTLREMYNRGEGHAPTSLTDVLKQVFPGL